MTQTITAAPATETTGGQNHTLDQAPGTRRRRRRILVWIGVLVAAVAVLMLVIGNQPQNTTPLHPDNAGDDGTRALARVLADSGVEVEVVGNLADLSNAGVGPGTTVAVVGTHQLTERAGHRLSDLASDADAVVLVPAPDDQSDDGISATTGEPITLQGSDHASLGAPSRARTPECEGEIWRDGDALTYLGPGINLGTDALDSDGVQACFPPSPGYNLGGASTWHLVTWAATTDRPQIRVFGGATTLTNAHITEEANAAAGIRLLGGSDRLVWYIPSPADGLEEGTGGMADVLPRGFLQAAAVLGLAVLALMFWRGRRLGRIVNEDLPAVIRSTETTRARAMMYRRARARHRALAALRVAARTRLATRLGLSKTAAPDAVADAVAERTGRPLDEVRSLLIDPAPGTSDSDLNDATMVRLARELRTLEEGITLR